MPWQRNSYIRFVFNEPRVIYTLNFDILVMQMCAVQEIFQWNRFRQNSFISHASSMLLRLQEVKPVISVTSAVQVKTTYMAKVNLYWINIDGWHQITKSGRLSIINHNKQLKRNLPWSSLKDSNHGEAPHKKTWHSCALCEKQWHEKKPLLAGP